MRVKNHTLQFTVDPFAKFSIFGYAADHMLGRLGAHAAVGTTAGLLGLAYGAANHDDNRVRLLSTVLGGLVGSGGGGGGGGEVTGVDQRDPTSLLKASVELANKSGGLCVLSTLSNDGGGASHGSQPRPRLTKNTLTLATTPPPPPPWHHTPYPQSQAV